MGAVEKGLGKETKKLLPVVEEMGNRKKREKGTVAAISPGPSGKTTLSPWLVIAHTSVSCSGTPVTGVSHKHTGGWRQTHGHKAAGLALWISHGIMNCQLPLCDQKLISKNTKAQWRPVEEFPDWGALNKSGIIQGEWWECCSWWEDDQEPRTSEHLAELFTSPSQNTLRLMELLPAQAEVSCWDTRRSSAWGLH